MVGLCLAFLLLVLVVIPQDDARARTMVLGLVMFGGQAAIGLFVRARADEVESRVDDVSRETEEHRESLRSLMCATCPGREGQGQLCVYPLCFGEEGVRNGHRGA